ncbi:hypothetical protein [Mesorhizobium sp. J428]|uniref:hypothetical protein n=1 Tax=Mesorhizobium sp. J428 TaxID=2898440 RepID=UPI002150B680|nr:hypothetical protein [Mesorhizobium sp. J428]MCR5858470.1 hypothetical protein [Mesorhizobium sp. J428]
MQHIAGQDLQQQRLEESRRDRREDRDELYDMVRPAVSPRRGRHAHRHAAEKRDGDGDEDQFEGRRERIAYVGGDGALGQQRTAEIALHEAA